MSEIEIFNYLVDIGCCNLCSLRHLGCPTKTYYTNFETYLEKNKIVKSETDGKKIKKNTCSVCLGLLQPDFIDSLLETIAGNADINNYDSTTFACALSLPISPQLRAFSLNQHLKDTYFEYFHKDVHEVPLKEAWKWVLGPKINERLNKSLDTGANCDFLITINLQYLDEDEELKVLLEVSPETFKKRTNFKKYRGEIFTRKSIEDFLNQVDVKTFKQYVPCPPKVPNCSLNFSNIFCTHNSIYIAGRYTKFSRELSQTPWILNGKRFMESSVQEIICEPLCSEFGFKMDDIKFVSSGREDCDVRCVGNGRPFVLDILNPKRTKISYDEFRALESTINKSKDVQVRDLQIVPKEDVITIKHGEESKTKVYQALCVSQEPISQEKIDKLNEIKALTLEQKTPIRVLHRRSLATRLRKIHNMNAKLVRDRMFIVDVETQAGTYVKEFVHGDFGRTKPSLCSVLGIEVDIIALDVTAIKLDWPKPVQYLENK